MKRMVFGFWFCIVSHAWLSQSPLDFSEIDAYARNCPKDRQTIASIVDYFQAIETTPIEKARLIYTWLTEFVAYDDNAFNTKKYGDYSPDAVVKSKLAVCAGFANVYQALGEKLGLDIVNITGCAKGYEYENDIGNDVEESINHAWNAIKIDGQWKIYDATWGQGSAHTNPNGKLESTKEFSDHWFQVDPKVAIYSHFPIYYTHQYLEIPLTFERFVEMPQLKPSHFLRQWLNPDEILMIAQSKSPMNFADYYEVIDHGTVKAPIDRKLKKGKTYLFELQTPDLQNAFLVNSNEDLIPFTKHKETYTFSLNPKEPGEYQIVVHRKDDHRYTLLTYELE
jgi:transglutaminase/protease-like cytokinesis protein 3